jgi:ubiquinone/menaquinone biosynthesis C-methylase UbiE
MNIENAIEVLGEKFSFSVHDTCAVIRELHLPKNSHVLDVGTGRGSLAITLALLGYTVSTGEPADDESGYANQGWYENATKVNVDHLLEFKAFDAVKIPYGKNSFDAIFSLGTFHHIEKGNRAAAICEMLRVAKQNAKICLFEPNVKAIELIRESDPTHPDAADPSDYIQDLGLRMKKIAGTNFDAFILDKA